MKKNLTLLALCSLFATKSAHAECVACKLADTSQEKNMARRKAIRAQKIAELQAQCEATNIRLKNQCEAQEANQDPRVRMFGHYKISGECADNCLQCKCEWVKDSENN